MLVASLAFGVEAVEMASSSGKIGVDSALSHTDKGTMNLSANRAMSISMGPPRSNTIAILGKIALPYAANNLTKLSQEVPTPEIIGAEGLAKLYSEIGSKFGIGRMPIKFFKYESQIPRSYVEMIPLPGKENLNFFSQNYLEKEPQGLPAEKIITGREDLNNGVVVIWHF